MALYDATVSAAWEASAVNPVAGRMGEQVEATARVEEWRETPGWTWRWCCDSHGREGWVPDALLAITGAEAKLREDYDARELTVAIGVRLTVERELAGWALCRVHDGAIGWVPLECLTPILMSQA
jgi:SH3-like domain-containing protein